MANWSALPTGIDTSQQTVGRNGIIFTATNSVTGEKVANTVFQTVWSVEDAISQCQGLITRLNARDALVAQSATNLPVIQAYIAGLSQPLATG